MRGRWFFSMGLALGIAAPAHAGTASLLLDISSGRASSAEAEVQGQFLSLGSVALAAIVTPGAGREIWVTDGTAVGTRLLLDLCPGACSSFFTPLGAVRKVGIFAARGENEQGSRLWRSDGTRPGTFALDASHGTPLQTCGSAAVAGSALLFSARTAGGECALWKTDGTAAGMVKMREERAWRTRGHSEDAPGAQPTSLPVNPHPAERQAAESNRRVK
jgi:ELWxxDGT repeat protein